ncbi:MAG: hypothetical protein AAF515_14990 [Pseudomonadota bacterium]
MSGMLNAGDEAAALEQLHELGCTDGLPVVIPTPERVERMVLASGQDPGAMLGEMGPAMGIATVEQIAVNAVMAGALPDYMPIVLAAVEAVLDPAFDLTEMQGTTHCTAPLIIVNGPARLACNVASSFGALGPGFRANASIGRALRLCMINIGGARPGVSDMALLGHPGKFTYCLAEDEENSPLPPLHVARGFAADDSCVTVIGAEAPHSVIFSGDADNPETPSALLDVLATGLANLATNNAVLRGGSAVVVLNPDMAETLTNAGYDRGAIARGLCERTSHSRSELAGIWPQAAAHGDPDDGCAAFRDPDQILVMMAGGSGLYSMVMPSWCAGAHQNSAVTKRIDLNPFCEVPGLSEH